MRQATTVYILSASFFTNQIVLDRVCCCLDYLKGPKIKNKKNKENKNKYITPSMQTFPVPRENALKN